ncbi:MAG: ABC transporter permease subunit [bacterium]|nr:ABC transporter permease subunit [bacterium]
MRNVYYIAQREIKSYFSSPIAYVLIAAFLLVSGFFYVVIINFTRTAELGLLFHNIAIMLLLLSPVITMRLIAEERRTGTIELLLTAPITETEAVVGKYFGAVCVYLLMLILTLHFPLFLIAFGNPDKGPIISGYLGLFLMGSSFLAIGILASSFARNQIVAAVFGFSLLLLLWLFSAIAQQFSGPVGSVIQYLSIYEHFNNFIRGIIDTQDIIYFLSFIIIALFLAVRVMHNKKWK